jgi:putative sigma-54 modulation protein
MNIEITARHFHLTPELKSHIEREVGKLRKYFESIIASEVILDVEKYRQRAEIRIRVYRDTIAGTADSDDMYTSVESALDKVKGQLKKYKSRLKEKRPEEILETVEKITRPETDIDEVEL